MDELLKQVLLANIPTKQEDWIAHVEKLCWQNAEIIRLKAEVDDLREFMKGRRIAIEAADWASICDHYWVDARNEHIQSGEYCPKCHSIREGNQHPTSSGGANNG